MDYETYRNAVVADVHKQMAEHGWSEQDASSCVMSVETEWKLLVPVHQASARVIAEAATAE